MKNIGKALMMRSAKYFLIIVLFLLTISNYAAKCQDNSMKKVDVAEIDQQRILEAANKYLNSVPVTITNFIAKRSTGGIHDYYSDSDYWWPNPKDPDGPYIRRDGMSNPDNFDQHRLALRNMSIQVAALTAAYKITGDKKYADKARQHLLAWFVNEKTMMNPNLEHAQAVRGVTSGRSVGIIDTIHLVEVAQAIMVLEKIGYLNRKDADAIKEWFRKYLEWLKASKFGIEERDRGNNHSTCYIMQAAEFAKLVGDTAEMDYCRNFYETVLLPDQMEADGSYPKELARTKPYSYSIFNQEIMSMVCEILSDKQHDLWHFTNDRKNIGLGMKFLYPYLADKSKWHYPKDVMYFDLWPVRQVSLLFCGIHLGEKKYIDLWKKLNPDPKVEEGIRNFPIRYPVLWIN